MAGAVFAPAVVMATVVRAVPRVGGVGAGGENAHHEDECRQEPRQYPRFTPKRNTIPPQDRRPPLLDNISSAAAFLLRNHAHLCAAPSDT